jgi:hypothetical protein
MRSVRFVAVEALIDASKSTRPNRGRMIVNLLVRISPAPLAIAAWLLLWAAVCAALALFQ